MIARPFVIDYGRTTAAALGPAQCSHARPPHVEIEGRSVADYLHYCTIPSRATAAQPMTYQCWAIISDSGSLLTEDLSLGQFQVMMPDMMRTGLLTLSKPLVSRH